MAAKKEKKTKYVILELPVPEKPLMIKLHRNWADEFDVEGFVCMDASEWEAHKEFAKAYFKKKGYLERYFGTNEFLEFSSYEDYVKAFEVVELSATEYLTLKKLFTIKGYSWEHPKGKTNVVRDRVEFGCIPRLDPNEDKLDDEEE